MRKVLAHIFTLKAQLSQNIKQNNAILTSNMDSTALIDGELLQEASDCIIKLFQAKYFKDELDKMKQKERSLSKASALFSFNSFIDGKGIIRVGGRIRRSELYEEYMHPIILPKKSKVTELIIKCCLDYQCKFHNKIGSV